MEFTPGQIVVIPASNFRGIASNLKYFIHPLLYQALATADHLMIVDEVDNDTGEVWVCHVDKKPNGWEEETEGRVFRRAVVAREGLLLWPLQPLSAAGCLEAARKAVEKDERPIYTPGTFDCQTWVYECASLTQLTPSQVAVQDMKEQGVDFMDAVLKWSGR